MTGGGAPAAQCHRYFFALRPDAAAAARTLAFAERELGARGLVRAERLHVTLALSTDYPEPAPPVEAALVEAASAVRAAAFGLPLTRLVGHSKVVWIEPGDDLPALAALQADLAARIAAKGIAMRPDWQFTPHETLAYRKGDPFVRAVPDQGWRADRLWLVHSHVGLGRHALLGEWPLHG